MCGSPLLSLTSSRYSIFWLLPRYSTANWVPEDVGGCDSTCSDGTVCFSILCYSQALLQLFAFACVLWEVVLLVYTSYCIRFDRSNVSPTVETLFHLVCWGVSTGLGLFFLYNCLRAAPENRLSSAKSNNELMIYIWFGVVGPAAIFCIYVNAVIVRRQKALLQQEFDRVRSINRGYISRTGRINRTTLVNLQRSILDTAVIPLRAYGIAFFILALPQVAYVVWDRITNDPYSRNKVSL